MPAEVVILSIYLVINIVIIIVLLYFERYKISKSALYVPYGNEVYFVLLCLGCIIFIIIIIALLFYVVGIGISFLLNKIRGL